MKSIALEKLHTELGAKFGPFAGYNMPIQYPMGLKGEHLHTRSHAGLFDVSHMGQLRITAPKDPTGAQLRKGLESALPCDFDGWPNDTQRYSMLLNDRGGIEDDLMLVWRDGSSTANGSAGGLTDTPTGMPNVRMVVNAGNRDHDLTLLQTLCPNLKFEWVNAALIALQGPDAESVLAKLDPKAEQMKFMKARDLTLCGVTCFTTRSGYTGEDGFEISIPFDAAHRVVSELMKDQRVKPVGLGARDTLRLEAGLPLHGNDINPATTPVEAGLTFGIAPSRRAQQSGAGGQFSSSLKSGGFPGASIVLNHLSQGVGRKLVGMISREPVPIRAHSKIVNSLGKEVGEVTSGTVSPSLGYPIMLAMIPMDSLKREGETLFAMVRNKRLAVEITKLPFVPKRYKR